MVLEQALTMIAKHIVDGNLSNRQPKRPAKKEEKARFKKSVDPLDWWETAKEILGLWATAFNNPQKRNHQDEQNKLLPGRKKKQHVSLPVAQNINIILVERIERLIQGSVLPEGLTPRNGRKRPGQGCANPWTSSFGRVYDRDEPRKPNLKCDDSSREQCGCVTTGGEYTTTSQTTRHCKSAHIFYLSLARMRGNPSLALIQ